MKTETIQTELTKEQQFIILDLLHSKIDENMQTEEKYNKNKEYIRKMIKTVEAIQNTWNK
jgi:hypothetical protein